MRIAVRALVATLTLGGMSAALSASKPAPAIDPDWKCSLQLRDAPGDAITSDGGGPYVHGAAGVECKIVRGRESHYNWLYVVLAGTSPRSMMFPAQTNGSASYLAFANKGTFEVKALADVAWTGTPYTDVRPFRGLVGGSQFSRGRGQFDGHSNLPGGVNMPDGAVSVGTSSVFVEVLDACAWRIASHTSGVSLTSGERPETVTSPTRFMRLFEGAYPKVTARGDFPMQFGATVQIIGNRADCLP